MRPILVEFGDCAARCLPISSFGLFLLLAFVVGIAIARRRGTRLGIDPSQMLDLSLYMIIGGIIVGRLGYAIMNWPTFAASPVGILTIWKDSGLTFYGALLGGLLVAWVFADRRKIPLRKLMDVFAPALALGYAVAMVGALLHGLYVGRPSGVPWAVTMLLDRRHPTQIYLLLASLGTYQVLKAQERQEAMPGVLFFLWLLLFSLARLAVEFFVESPALFGPFTLAQIANVVAAVIGVVGLVVSARRSAPEPEVASPTV
jgi:phosphatidylglycerol:prolipoprotein diacylglycerol transferase